MAELKPVEGDGPPERQANGLLIERTFTDKGFGVTLHAVGDMRQTEILSVLRLALVQAERQLSADR